MSDINNNIPTRITQLEEATGYEDGMFFAVAKAGRGTYKIPVDEMTPNEQALSDKMENEIVPAVENSFAYGTVDESEIASFPDGSNLPMPKLEVAVEPQQEGSGDPSPTNIRPISGWSEANVSVCGKNLFDKTTATDGKYYSATVEEVGNANKGHSALIKVKSGKTYYMSGYAGIGLYTVLPLNINKELISGWYDGASKTESFVCTLPPACEYVYLNYNIEQKDAIIFAESNSAVPFTPYNGQTYTIQFKDGDNPLTVYGGTLDVVSGVLTVDKGYVDLGTLNYTYYSGNLFTASISNLKPVFNVNLCNALCSIYVAKKGIEYTSIDGSFVAGFNYLSTLAIHDSRFTDATAFKTAMNGVQLVYELATPTTIQLTPTQVKSLKGYNNISADTGNILKVEYIRDLDIVINSLLERIAALEG